MISGPIYLFLTKIRLKKVLIIRLSSIGDIVLTTPVIRCLKKQASGCEVHYVTKKQFLPVLEANPFIDKIYVLEKSIHEVIPNLKAERYDHIVDLHRNFRSLGIRLKLGRKSSTFNKINLRKWLLVKLKINTLPDVHIVDRYFGAVAHLGVKSDQLGLDYFIPARDVIHMETLPASHQNGYIGWVIGGKHNTKIYPEEKVAAVCKSINSPVVLIGGPEDAEKGDRIAIESGDHVFNACGKFNLNKSASLVKNASLVLTNDTGMMHIAAAFKKQIISFWGNTIPQFGMYPYLPGEENKSTILQVSKLSCRPCSKIGYPSCPKGHFRCMQDIDARKVIELIGKGQ